MGCPRKHTADHRPNRDGLAILESIAAGDFLVRSARSMVRQLDVTHPGLHFLEPDPRDLTWPELKATEIRELQLEVRRASERVNTATVN